MYPVIILSEPETIPNESYTRPRRNTISEFSLKRNTNLDPPSSPSTASKTFFNKLWKNRKLSTSGQRKDLFKTDQSADLLKVEEPTKSLSSMSPSAIRRSLTRRFSQAPENHAEHMLQAIQHQDINTLDKFLSEPANNNDINTLRSTGASMFHQACVIGNIKIVKRLVARGADIHAKTRTNMSPVKLAAMFGNYEIAQYLIDQGADSKDIKNGLQDDSD